MADLWRIGRDVLIAVRTKVIRHSDEMTRVDVESREGVSRVRRCAGRNGGCIRCCVSRRRDPWLTDRRRDAYGACTSHIRAMNVRGDGWASMLLKTPHEAKVETLCDTGDFG